MIIEMKMRGGGYRGNYMLYLAICLMIITVASISAQKVSITCYLMRKQWSESYHMPNAPRIPRRSTYNPTSWGIVVHLDFLGCSTKLFPQMNWLPVVHVSKDKMNQSDNRQTRGNPYETTNEASSKGKQMAMKTHRPFIVISHSIPPAIFISV